MICVTYAVECCIFSPYFYLRLDPLKAHYLRNVRVVCFDANKLHLIELRMCLFTYQFNTFNPGNTNIIVMVYEDVLISS